MKAKFTALAAAALFFAAPVTVFADDYEPYDNSSRAGHVELYAGYGTPSVIPYFVEIFAGLFCTDNLSVFAELGFISNSFAAGGITYRF